LQADKAALDATTSKALATKRNMEDDIKKAEEVFQVFKG